MENVALYNFCVSTIVERRRLEEFALKGHARFVENRTWRTADRLLKESKASGKRMPVLLSDAAYNSERLPLWGILQKLEIKDESTAVHLVDVKRVRGNHGRQDLRLRTTGQRVSPVSAGSLEGRRGAATRRFISCPGCRRAVEFLFLPLRAPKSARNRSLRRLPLANWSRPKQNSPAAKAAITNRQKLFWPESAATGTTTSTFLTEE